MGRGGGFCRVGGNGGVGFIKTGLPSTLFCNISFLLEKLSLMSFSQNIMIMNFFSRIKIHRMELFHEKTEIRAKTWECTNLSELI